MTINQFADMVYANAISKGFHDGKANGQTDEEFLATACNNMHGEISELWEALRERKLKKPCDKSDKMIEMGLTTVPLTCEAEELADIIIRAFDNLIRLGYDDPEEILMIKHRYNITRPHMHGKAN